MDIAQGGAFPIQLLTNGVVRIHIKETGEIGFGTVVPGHKLTVEGNGDSNTGIFAIDVTGSGAFKWASTAIAPNLAAGNNIIHVLGQAESAKNSANFGFNYQSAGSNNNFLTMGLFGVDNILNITAAGYVGIATTAPKSPLHVVGLPVYANNAAALAGGLTAGAFYRTGGDPDPVCVVH